LQRVAPPFGRHCDNIARKGPRSYASGTLIAFRGSVSEAPKDTSGAICPFRGVPARPSAGNGALMQAPGG
jgi:hypothetical protein